MTPIKPVSNPHVCHILAAAWAALPTEETYAMLAAAPAPVPNSRELIVSKLQTECSAVVDDTNHLVSKLSAKYPPAVNLTMHDVLRALEAVPGAPMMTSNMCHAIAQQLNAAQPTDQLPVGYVHFKAPVRQCRLHSRLNLLKL